MIYDPQPEPAFEDLLACPHLQFNDAELLPLLLAYGPPQPAQRPWLFEAVPTTTVAFPITEVPPMPETRQSSDEYEEPAAGPVGPSGVSPAPEPAPVTVTIDVDTSHYGVAVNRRISAVLQVELEQARGLLERAFSLRENGRPWDPAWQRWDTDTGQFLRSSSNDPPKEIPMADDLNLDRIRRDVKDVSGRRVVTDHILPTLSRLIVEDVPAMADELERLREANKALADMMERVPEIHMRFGVLLPDGTVQPATACADWCWLCRVEQAEAKRDALKAAIDGSREALTAALSDWEANREYHQERYGRKGYSHDEAAVEAYDFAIKGVTEALAALDHPTEESTDGA